MVASADNSGKALQAAMFPPPAASTDRRPDTLSVKPEKPTVRGGYASGGSGTLTSVAKSGSNKNAEIDYERIDGALAAGKAPFEVIKEEIVRVSGVDLDNLSLASAKQELNSITATVKQIIDHYQRQDSKQFAKIHDIVYGELKFSILDRYIFLLEHTYRDPIKLNDHKSPENFIIITTAKALLEPRLEIDNDGSDKIDRSKVVEKRYDTLVNFVVLLFNSGITNPPKIFDNGGNPIKLSKSYDFYRFFTDGQTIKALMLECKKQMHVNDAHKQYIAHMAEVLRWWDNQYVNEAISEFEKAAGL